MGIPDHLEEKIMDGFDIAKDYAVAATVPTLIVAFGFFLKRVLISWRNHL